MNRANLRAGIYLLLVFLSGAVLGVFSYRLYTFKSVSADTRTTAPKSPEDYRRRYVSEMTTRLKLTPVQIGSLEKILDETRARFHEFHERTRPQLDTIQQEQKTLQEEHRQKVAAMLTGVQKTEYQKMIAERDARKRLEQEQRRR